MAKKQTKKVSKSSMMIKEMGHEMKMNPPKVLAKTMAKKGMKAMEKQRTAIMLNKARKAGAKIKKK